MTTQRQDSLTDQLRDVRQLANENGCYDAADFIASARDRLRELERSRVVLIRALRTYSSREDAALAWGMSVDDISAALGEKTLSDRHTCMRHLKGFSCIKTGKHLLHMNEYGEEFA